MSVAIKPIDEAALVDRLAAHNALSSAPRSELEWLAAHGEVRRFQAGEIILSATEEVTFLAIVLSGNVAVHIDHGTGRRHSFFWRAGTLTGLLPFSRLVQAMSDVVAEEATEAVTLQREFFPELIRECPTVTAMMVHTMVDRARRFTAENWQDEKMLSLGRLAAGMAHELNNPASAAERSANRLSESMTAVGEAAYALGAANLSEPQRAQVAELLTRCLLPSASRELSPIERADREDAFATWLVDHRANAAAAPSLADTSLTVPMLNELAESLQGVALDAALCWITAAYTSQALAADVQRATVRIHELVSAMKRFTYMDRAAVAEPTAIAQGLADTITVMAARARAKSAIVRLEVAPDLPMVSGHTGDLNQLWSELLSNALDAVAHEGQVVIQARAEADNVVVRMIDDGAGIPPEVQSRMFDPFFSTKAVGEGRGLGLDLVRRIVVAHEGQIDVESRPGRTEFRVSIPTARQ